MPVPVGASHIVDSIRLGVLARRTRVAVMPCMLLFKLGLEKSVLHSAISYRSAVTARGLVKITTQQLQSVTTPVYTSCSTLSTGCSTCSGHQTHGIVHGMQWPPNTPGQYTTTSLLPCLSHASHHCPWAVVRWPTHYSSSHTPGRCGQGCMEAAKRGTKRPSGAVSHTSNHSPRTYTGTPGSGEGSTSRRDTSYMYSTTC